MFGKNLISTGFLCGRLKWDEFLQRFKTKYDNPFSEKGFTLVGEETYGDGHWVHRIEGVYRVFGEDFLSIIFKKKDLILALAVTSLTLRDPYGFDLKAEIFVNQSKLEIDHTSCAKSQDLFLYLYGIVDKLDSDTVEIGVLYKKKNCFTYEKQVMFYIIDFSHTDNYYRDLEAKRWEDGDVDIKL